MNLLERVLIAVFVIVCVVYHAHPRLKTVGMAKLYKVAGTVEDVTKSGELEIRVRNRTQYVGLYGCAFPLPGQPGYGAGPAFLLRVLYQSRVTVTFPGRISDGAVVMYWGTCVNERVLALGYAWMRPRCDTPECWRWKLAYEQARNESAGLWGEPGQKLPPWEVLRKIKEGVGHEENYDIF